MSVSTCLYMFCVYVYGPCYLLQLFFILIIIIILITIVGNANNIKSENDWIMFWARFVTYIYYLKYRESRWCCSGYLLYGTSNRALLWWWSGLCECVILERFLTRDLGLKSGMFDIILQVCSRDSSATRGWDDAIDYWLTSFGLKRQNIAFNTYSPPSIHCRLSTLMDCSSDYSVTIRLALSADLFEQDDLL